VDSIEAFKTKEGEERWREDGREEPVKGATV